MKHLCLPLLASKNSNIDSYKTVIHLCAKVPQKLPRRAKAETYLAPTQYQTINHPSKLLDNSNIHWLLKTGTCCKINISQSLSNTFLIYPMTFWLLWTKVHVSFNWSDAADDNNNKTLTVTSHSSQHTQTQDNKWPPTTQQESNNKYFGDNACILTKTTTSRRQLRQWQQLINN